MKNLFHATFAILGRTRLFSEWKLGLILLLYSVFSAGCPYDFPAVIVDGGEDLPDALSEAGTIDCDGGCEVKCSNESTTDCNVSGSTLTPDSAFLDPDPPEGFIQCAGFINTDVDNVTPDWEGNCLGVERVLRVRYWDTSGETWTLLGDGTLSPASTSVYDHQIFDAGDHGGTEGVLANAGVELLKDAPGEVAPSYIGCDNPGLSFDYAASDLILANRTNTKTLWVCSADHSIADKPCDPKNELVLVEAEKGTCISDPGDFNHLAIAIYFLKEN